MVVAFVETHGRQHTAALIGGLEIVPRARMTYRGATIRGDGPRRRAGPAPADRAGRRARPHQRPRVAQRQALARTSRNCSTAGIDVISNVNIQHLESLNDVVQKVTGVPQRETVPDAMVRGRRPGRAGRHDAGGAAPPDGARQHLPAREDRRRADRLLPGRQPGRSPRAGAALAGRQGR